MKRINYSLWITALLAVACSSDDADKAFVHGEAMNLTISLANDATTRTLVNPDGTVFVKSDKSTVTKTYTYDSGSSSFMSDNPLVWLDKNMTITGYFYRINGIGGDLTFLYTVDASKNQTSYCAGQTSVVYPANVSLSLRQQLAKIEITVTADDGTGTVQSNPKLGGGMLYMTGTFDPSTFNASGYATGGTDGTGWIPSVNTDKKTIGMTTVSSSGGVYKYSAVILPQKISDTSTPFFTVDVGPNASTVLTTVKYNLRSATTFKAGYTYTLNVDNVTNTLYIESGIQVEDFTDFNANRRSASTISNTWTTS